MAIQQTKRQSDLEKRLQILRRQVYGKSPERTTETKMSETPTHRYTDTLHRPTDAPTNRTTDLTYLNQDLLKILIFSSLAIGAQIVLFFLSKNQIINLKFF